MTISAGNTSEQVDIHNCDIYSLAQRNPYENSNVHLEQNDYIVLSSRLKLLMNDSSAEFTQEQLYKIGALVLNIATCDLDTDNELQNQYVSFLLQKFMPSLRVNDFNLNRFSTYALGNLDSIDTKASWDFRSQLTQKIKEHLAGGQRTFLCTSDKGPSPLKYLAYFVNDEGLKEMLLIIDKTILRMENAMR